MSDTAFLLGHAQAAGGGAAALPPPAFLDAADGSLLLQGFEGADGRMRSPIQFMSARSGEGTSAMARDVSLIAVRDWNLRVLLLDMDPPGGRQAASLTAERSLAAADPRLLIAPPRQLAATALDHLRAEFDVQEIGATGLHVSRRIPLHVPQSQQWREMIALLHEAFDLVVIDSPPLQRGIDGIRRAPHVAATIIVVEAETTRSSDVVRLRQRIDEFGGEIAGCVFNKRKSYIPAWVERFL